MANLEERVDRLDAIEAIRQLLVDFVAACDDGYGADRIAALFTDDAVMDLGPLGVHEGREAIHAFFASISVRIPSTVHFQSNYEVVVDASGTEARGRWYGLEMPVFDGRAAFGAFTYEDRYRKQDGRWLISQLAQRLRFFTDYDRGWARQPSIEL